MRTVEKGDGGVWQSLKEKTPSAKAVTLPLPHPRKFWIGENGKRTGLQLHWQGQGNMPGKR